MDATHGAVAIGTTTVTAWMTTLLTGWNGLTDAKAAAISGMLTLGASTVALFGSRVVLHYWPWLAGTAANTTTTPAPQQQQ